MARPRREDEEYTALYVRIPSDHAEKLHRASDFLQTPKRELITKLVAEFDPEDPVWTRPVAGPVTHAEFGFGQHSFRPAAELEILTPSQLAGLLQVDEDVVVELAESGELPGRRVGEEWRFSREAILAWLAADE